MLQHISTTKTEANMAAAYTKTLTKAEMHYRLCSCVKKCNSCLRWSQTQRENLSKFVSWADAECHKILHLDWHEGQ